MDEAVNKLAAYLGDRLGTKLSHSEVALGELTIAVERDQIPEIIQLLRDDPLCRFGCLIDICGVDYPEREERFDVVYHLLSPWLNHRIRVRTTTDAAHPVPSIVGAVPGGRLVRARGLRPLRHSVLRPSGSQAAAHRLRLPGPSFAQGLPAHRLRRAPIRRRAEARGL